MDKLKEEFLEYIKFSSDDDIYEIILGRTKDNIIIRIFYFEIKLNLNDYFLLTKFKYNLIEELFDYFELLFEKQKFKIEDNTKYIKLILIIDDKIKYKEIELCLQKKLESKEYIMEAFFDKYKNLKEKTKQLEDENYKLKKELGHILSKFNSDLYNIIQIQQQMNPMINSFFKLNFINVFIRSNFISIVIQVQKNDLILTLKNIFFNKYYIPENKRKDCKFIYCNNTLDDDALTVDEVGIKDNSYIELYISEQYFDINNAITFYIISHKNKQKVYSFFNENDLVSEFIQKFRIKAQFEEDAKYILNGKPLNMNITCKEAGINNNSIIYAILDYYIINIDIFAYFKDIKIYSFNLDIKSNKLIVDLIKECASYIGLKECDIDYLKFNSIKLDKNKNIKESGIENNSEISLFLKKNLEIITIIFSKFNDNNEETIVKIDCIKSFTIFRLIEEYKKKTKNYDVIGYFIFKEEELKNYFLSIEEAGLKNNDIIYIRNYKSI